MTFFFAILNGSKQKKGAAGQKWIEFVLSSLYGFFYVRLVQSYS